MKRVHTVRRPEEFKALADARRIKVLGWLTQGEFTVTQLAERLGEIPATMHHHVKLLERAGLVKIAYTREKSGILEKYYRAVAERVIADQGVGRLSEPAAIALDAAGGALRVGLDRLDAARADAAFTAIEELRLTSEQASALAFRLQQVLESAGTGDSGDGEPWLAVIALYPVATEGG
ncbi:MAG TPA: metalloregulator ArsR/SmtB family transcription factor [Bacillota bacterium]|nr:metalloregulator ArsR/SmtB family transcription factor [Bacillota bacterium]